MKILLVGCGKMGQALLDGWTEAQIYSDCQIIDPTRDIQTPDDLPEDFQPNVIVFAVKPQVMKDVLPFYQKYVSDQVIFLSIAAGTTLSFFEQHLGSEAKVIRSMPNLPASIGKGISVLCANSLLSEEEKVQISPLLEAVGDVIWTEDESIMDAVTALSGSGPAYVFLLIEVLAEAGIQAGLEKEMAMQLARQTVIGSAALAEKAAEIPAATLRENVTSPGGTTEAALNILMNNNELQDLLNVAVEAAAKRSKELSS